MSTISFELIGLILIKSIKKLSPSQLVKIVSIAALKDQELLWYN